MQFYKGSCKGPDVLEFSGGFPEVFRRFSGGFPGPEMKGGDFVKNACHNAEVGFPKKKLESPDSGGTRKEIRVGG